MFGHLRVDDGDGAGAVLDVAAVVDAAARVAAVASAKLAAPAPTPAATMAVRISRRARILVTVVTRTPPSGMSWLVALHSVVASMRGVTWR
jgi:hypothetical protein